MTRERQFLQAFRPIMKAYGFKSQGDVFYKKTPESVWRYTAHCHYQYSVGFGVEICKFLIEEIYEKVFPHGKYGSINDIYHTIGMGAVHEAYHQWSDDDLNLKLQSEADIPKAVQLLQSIFEKTAQPFFQKFDPIEAIDRMYNGGIEDCNTHEEALQWRASRLGNEYEIPRKGLIIAKLLRSPDHYARLADKHLLVYQEEFPNLYLVENYDKLRKYLASDDFITFLHQKRNKKDPLLLRIDRIRQEQGLPLL